MKNLDLAAIEKIIADVAATEVMPRYCKLGGGDIEMKGVDDPVTVADKASEAALTARLADYLPGSVVVGEESHAKNPGILSRFGGEEDVWVIDPIDGTRNFIAGVPEFGVMVALVRRKQTVAAWLHDPCSGDTLMGERGGGVWLRGHKMRLAAHEPEQPFMGLIGSRLMRVLDKPEVRPLLRNLPAVEKGSSACFDYGRLFTGAARFANVEGARASFLLYRMSKPWDHVPGLSLVMEAGGYGATLRGKTYDPSVPKGGLLLAGSPEVWQTTYRAFKPALDTLFASASIP